MRRLLKLLLVAAAMAAGLPAGAEPTPGGFTTGPVEYVGTVPTEAGTAMSARKVGKYLYVGSFRTFSIYDVSEPEQPQLVSTTPLGFTFPAEDIDTNGKILLTSEETPRRILHVWDVRDKTSPTKLAEVPAAGNHTMTCVLGCRWAYGANGAVVDLRDPSSPKLAGQWTDVAQIQMGHDVTEVRPGFVVTSSVPFIYYLDVRDPLRPRVLATGDATYPGGFTQSNSWPRSARDKFLLVAGETPFSGRCDATSAAFMTWDASRWRQEKTFRLIDEYRVVNGTYTDGNPAHNTVGCSSSFSQAHPSFDDGGIVAAAFWDHGTRFLEVDSSGRITEIGAFLPHAGITGSVVWASNEIVYAIDQTHGIDILRFTGDVGP